MDAIGGYFSLELPIHEEYHKDALKLNTGRNCLEYILRCRQYSKVYIPYYTCDVILEPFQKLGIAFDFYHINWDFEITDDIQLKDNEALLYTNYYGLKQKYTAKLASRYGQKLIVDNTQAFFAKAIEGIDTFYTCRKFFGVPDGAYLYINTKLEEELEQDVSFERMSFLTKRIDLGAEAGYADFREQSHLLIGQPIKRMSKLTERLMQSIDYKTVAQKRHDNYLLYHKFLKKINKLKFGIDDNVVPMVYPFLSEIDRLRDYLIMNKVFVPQYWPNVLNYSTSSFIETELVNNLLPLPIDQRYDKSDIDNVKEILFGFVNNN